MSASLERSANGLKLSCAPHPGTDSILVEFKDVDDELEWILMPRSASSSAALRGVPRRAFIANQQVEIRGMPEHALGAHKFEAMVSGCYLQSAPGTLSAYLVAKSHQATSVPGDDLERLFRSHLRLESSRTNSYRGKYTFVLAHTV